MRITTHAPAIAIGGGGGGDVINAASASLAHVQAAVDLAEDGDTVLLPSASSATWTSTLDIDKAIKVDFNGCTITRNFGTNASLMLASPPTGLSLLTRITNGTFAGGSTATGFNGTYLRCSIPTNGRFRLDNCTFESAGGNTHLQFYHAGYFQGLIDNCTFYNVGTHETIHNEAYGSGSTTGWAYTVSPGTEDALYVEDCVLLHSGTAPPVTNIMQNYYGSRTVMRYCDVENAQFDNHGTPGVIGGRWWECYENTFRTNAGCDKHFQLRGGSGVVYNNTLRNESGASGGRGIVLWEEDSGSYPLLYQIGRGKNQALDPAYLWNNVVVNDGGGTGGFVIGVDADTGIIEEDRDYYTSAKPGYTAYTYPHPLRSE